MRNHKDRNHMPMGHFPIPICHIGNGNWEMAHWHMVPVFMLPFVAVFALVTAAYAGGWAIITVNHVSRSSSRIRRSNPPRCQT